MGQKFEQDREQNEQCNKSMTGMRPKDAIKRVTVPLDKTYPKETVLPEDRLYRYLYQPGGQHGDQKIQATNLIWSKKTYRLDRIVQDPGNCVLYYLQDGPDRAFIGEELMHVYEILKYLLIG